MAQGEALPRKERRFNKRVNYYIMNRMWKYVQGGKNGGTVEELYRIVGMTKGSFSQFQKGDYDSGTLEERWEKKMTAAMGAGLSEYIRGEKILPLVGFTREDWDAYFTVRYSKERGEPLKKEQEEKRAGIMADTNQKLKEAFERLDENGTNPADLMFYFCRNKQARPQNLPAYYGIQQLKGLLEELTFSKWESCPADLRDSTRRLLKKHLEMAETIEVYQAFKENG